MSTERLGICKTLSFEDYRKNSAVSQSELKNLCKGIEYYKHMKENSIESPALRFGSMLHSYILEPNQFKKEYLVTDKVRRSGAKWDELQEKAKGKEIIFKEELIALKSMKESMSSNKHFSSIEKQSHKELSIFWRDENLSSMCKGRIDGFAKEQNLIFDIKTTRDCSEDAFKSSFFRYKYHIQAAFYMDGMKKITGEMPTAFIVFAIEKEPPYLNASYFIKSDSEVIMLGRSEYRALLARHRNYLDGKTTDVVSSAIKIDSIPPYYKSIGANANEH